MTAHGASHADRRPWRPVPNQIKSEQTKQRMYILGVSCFYHDAAAALLHNGHLVAAAEEERE